MSATLGGREEMEELVWTRWRWGMLSAGMRCCLKLLLHVGPLVIPMGKEEKSGWMTPCLGREEGSWPF